MRKKIFFITLLFILITTNAFALSVKVKVTNATRGKELSNYPLKILAVEQDNYRGIKVLKEYEFRTGALGAFEGEVEVFAAKAIMGEVNYKGVSYYSPLSRIRKEQGKYTFDINVYEITDKSDSIEMSGRSMTISPYDDKTVIVNDSVTFANNSKFTYVGKYDNKLKINKSLFIPLPAGYMLMSVNGVDRQDVYTLGSGIALHEKIIPGENSISLRYLVKSDIGIFDMSLHNEDYSAIAKKISIFFTVKENWKLKSTNLQHRGERNNRKGISGNVHAWDGDEVRALKFVLLSPSSKGSFGLWQASILAAFVLIGTGMVIMKKRIYRWKLAKENGRLVEILKRLNSEADDEDLKGYYKSFLDVLESRSREIEERLKP